MAQIDQKHVSDETIVDFLTAYIARKAGEAVASGKDTFYSESEADVATVVAGVALRLFKQDMASREQMEALLGKWMPAKGKGG